MGSAIVGKLASIKGEHGIWQVQSIQSDPTTGRLDVALWEVVQAFTQRRFKLVPLADLTMVSRTDLEPTSETWGRE